MAKIFKTRTVRPSTRLATSVSYKINTESVGMNDSLDVTIYSESGTIIEHRVISGTVVAGRRSIHFNYSDGKIHWPQYI